MLCWTSVINPSLYKLCLKPGVPLPISAQLGHIRLKDSIGFVPHGSGYTQPAVCTSQRHTQRSTGCRVSQRGMRQTWDLESLLQCRNAWAWTHLSLSNKTGRNYIGLKITAYMCGSGGLVAKPCLTLGTPWTVACQAPLSMGSPGKNTGMNCS